MAVSTKMLALAPIDYAVADRRAVTRWSRLAVFCFAWACLQVLPWQLYLALKVSQDTSSWLPFLVVTFGPPTLCCGTAVVVLIRAERHLNLRGSGLAAASLCLGIVAVLAAAAGMYMLAYIVN